MAASTAESLRAHLALVAQAKSRAQRDDISEHLAASCDERLDATLRLSQRWIDARGDVDPSIDDDAETWRRVCCGWGRAAVERRATPAVSPGYS
ncbi:MAG: hypothetical protein IPK07_09695 [Deltaproteobacteria bacterium]|nr:hypothetical protein [Deltaproteobacteria bacterium]